MPALAPPPYVQPAPDGNTYFKYLPEVRGLVRVWADGTALVSQLRGMPHPAAKPKAALLAHALTQLESEVLAGEITVAEATDISVRAKIEATRKRPPNPSGPQMENSIVSRPVRPLGSPLPLFAVGLVDIDILDRGTTSRSGGTYWRTQEFGYGGFVGHQVYGFFEPGRARPDPAQFRTHPIFAAGPGARMTIGRPIEARAFLRGGVADGALMRERLWKAMEARALIELRRAATFVGPRRRRR